MDLPTRHWNGAYSSRNARLVFPTFLDEDTWPVNSPDLNPLDHRIWEEFSQAVNWNKVTSKSSLISEVTRSVKKIRLYVVRRSWSVWTNGLYRMTQRDENSLRK